jgi:hypothetical protein
MATASVSQIDLQVPKHVSKGDPIGPGELTVDFTVNASADGCYAMAVYLYDNEKLIPDELVASNLHQITIPCNCLRKGRPQKFTISGHAGAAPAAGGGAIQLGPPGLKGKWPQSDGPFDDVMELYVKIEVYYCREACPATGGCNPIRTQRLTDLVGVGTTEDEAFDVTIIDGSGTREGIDLLKEGGKAAGGFVKSELPQAPGGGQAPGAAKSLLPGFEEVALAQLAERVNEMRRELVRLERGRQLEVERSEEREHEDPG